MKSWYKVVDDIELKDGSTIKQDRLVFETTDKELSKEVEKFFQSIMDRSKQTEPLMAMLEGGEDVHEFCKNCDKSKYRMFDGERYIVCGQADDSPSITLKKCPLSKWICENTYLITDCAWK